MTLEQQVTSLELSQKLKELGVKQDKKGLFTWVKALYLDDRVEWQIWSQHEMDFEGDMDLDNEQDWCSAFTVSELGNLIGPAKNRDIMKAYGHIFNVPDTRFVNEIGLLMVMTQPDLAAKMLIYLIENKLITL